MDPAMIQAWGRRLQQQAWPRPTGRRSSRTCSGMFTLRSMTSESNATRALASRSPGLVRVPQGRPGARRAVQPVHEQLGQRYRVAVTIGPGCGLRQGEAFGLSIDQADSVTAW